MPTFDTLPFFSLGFYISLLLFTVHVAILSYHWITYGASKRQSLVSVAVYIIGGLLLLLMLFATLSLL